MGALLEVVLPVFLVMGFGYAAVKYNLFSADGVDGLMAFTQSFAIPCLLFRAISTLDLNAYFEPRLLISFYLPAIILFFVGLFASRILFTRPWEDCVAIGFCILYANTVLLGLPITERAYGADALSPNYALIAINAPICYFLGITTMEIVRNRGGSFFAVLRKVVTAIVKNPLVIGVSLGFVVNLSGITLHGTLTDAVDLMTRAALPAAIFGLGGVLAQYKMEGDVGPVVLICVSTLLILPAMTWGLGRAAGLDEAAFRSAVVTAATAPGVNGYVFANMYGVAKRVAASAVLVSTALSIITVWMWLGIIP